jgi:acyl carrier protein
MLIILIIIALLVISVLSIRAEKKAKAKKLATVFADRESLSIDEFYQRHYSATDIPYPIVIGVINILAEQLDTDMSRLCIDDDFSKNLSFFWDYDSMANVEIICALEKKFNIQILDAEAEQTKTVNDLVTLVSRKTATLNS